MPTPSINLTEIEQMMQMYSILYTKPKIVITKIKITNIPSTIAQQFPDTFCNIVTEKIQVGSEPQCITYIDPDTQAEKTIEIQIPLYKQQQRFIIKDFIIVPVSNLDINTTTFDQPINGQVFQVNSTSTIDNDNCLLCYLF